MKSSRKTLVTLGALALSISTVAGCTGGITNPPDPRNTELSQETRADSRSSEMAPATADSPDAQVAWDALMGPDGEYAAAALYQAVIDTHGEVEPYVTIKASEDRHIDALKRQLDRFGVEIPENPWTETAIAPTDLKAAAEAWAIGEVANVEMYDDLLLQTDDPNLTRVLENLRRASLESHLPLFEKAAENGGTLDPEEMASVREAHGEGAPEARAMRPQNRNEGRAGQRHQERPTRGQHSPDL